VTAFVKGGFIDSMINKIVPAANKSITDPFYGLLACISGAIYDSVPKCVYNLPVPSLPDNNILKPKSAIFKLKLESNNIFSGFKSLCANPEL
jgi:hypothetical protein